MKTLSSIIKQSQRVAGCGAQVLAQDATKMPFVYFEPLLMFALFRKARARWNADPERLGKSGACPRSFRVVT